MDETPIPTGRIDRHTIALLRSLRKWRLRGWLIASGFHAAAFLGLYLVRTSPPPRITEATYHQITAGMSEREVATLVGARPGGYGMFWGPGETIREEWAGDPRCR